MEKDIKVVDKAYKEVIRRIKEVLCKDGLNKNLDFYGFTFSVEREINIKFGWLQVWFKDGESGIPSSFFLYRHDNAFDRLDFDWFDTEGSLSKTEKGMFLEAYDVMKVLEENALEHNIFVFSSKHLNNEVSNMFMKKGETLESLCIENDIEEV